jgi:glycosyltransferase involved in cell wall biosynthesis
MTAWSLISGDFATSGGMDRANHALASFLANSGHSVHLVGHRIAPDLAAHPRVTVQRVPKPLGSYLLGRWPLRWMGLKRGRATLATGGHVVVNGGNCPLPDVNWVHYVHAAYRPDVPASRLRRLKARIERPMELRAELASVRAARVVVCNSHSTRRDVIDRLGVDSRRAVTVYYGTDPSAFAPASPEIRTALRERLGWPLSRPVVLFVGALGDRRKGFDTLFNAWAELSREKEWDALLAVVGRGAELPLWERRTEEAGLTDRIRFLGFRSDVPDLLRAADAMVHPARYEAYGLGVHEALCCGLPTIVSGVAGVSERYPTRLADLLLSDPESSAELADRLRLWRAHMESLAARVRPLAEELRSYTWARMARDMVAAIEGMPVDDRQPASWDAAPANSRPGPVDVPR